MAVILVGLNRIRHDLVAFTDGKHSRSKNLSFQPFHELEDTVEIYEYRKIEYEIKRLIYRVHPWTSAMGKCLYHCSKVGS